MQEIYIVENMFRKKPIFWGNYKMLNLDHNVELVGGGGVKYEIGRGFQSFLNLASRPKPSLVQSLVDPKPKGSQRVFIFFSKSISTINIRV